MSLSPIEVGSIGFVAGMAIKEAFALAKKSLDKKNGKNNLVPGYSDSCIRHGEKLTEHDTAIKQLCKEVIEVGGKVETMRKENREDLARIFTILDTINKKNGG